MCHTAFLDYYKLLSFSIISIISTGTFIFSGTSYVDTFYIVPGKLKVNEYNLYR